MTLKEAKKILKEEGYFLVKVSKGFEFSELPVWEKPEVVEAKRVVNKNGFATAMNTNEWLDRQERLKKEYGKDTKAPGPGEEQPKENSLKAATDAFILQANELIRLKKKNAELLEAIDKMKEGNPALKESASQFNDALLDEQAKEIERLKEKNLRLGKEIARLNKTIYKKNLKIEELRKESSRHLRGKIKMFGESFDLEQELKNKNAVLSDVAEELRLTKIREKNLTEVGQKYMKENEELKKELADKVVDKINANALKSAESALACKEQLIYYKDKIIAYYKKKYVWYKGAYDAAQQILNTIADYAAKHPDKKISDPMVGENHPTEDNPEEIEIEEAVKIVRKAMKEGHTVTIDYKD